jgi:membrane-associated phospholipid phosphatase
VDNTRLTPRAIARSALGNYGPQFEFLTYSKASNFKEVSVALVTIKPTKVDLCVAQFIASYTNRKAEGVAKVLTWGADEKALMAATAFAWLVCRNGLRSDSATSRHVFIATAVSTVLPHLLKRLIDQERPDRLTVAGHRRGIPISGKKYDAFPSGHAVHIGALASAATLLPRRWRNAAWLAGGVLACTRVILLAHWLSDVAAGLAIGCVLERAVRPLTIGEQVAEQEV